MNRLINGLVTGLLLMFSLHLTAQPIFTISPQNVNAEVNQEFTVDVVVSNFSNVASLQFPIVWDPAVLEYVSVSNVNSTALPGFSQASSFGVPPAVGDNKVTISWFEANFNGINLPDGTVLFSITLRGKADGTSQIAITNDPPGIEVTNPDEQNIGLTPKNATVVVGTGNGGGGGGGTGDGTFSLMMPDKSVDGGQDVCLQVTVDDFVDIVGMQFTIEYDPNALQFKEVRNFNLDGLELGVFGLPGNGSNVSPGKVTLAWNDPAANGINLDDGTVIFEICFKAIGSGATEVRFSNTPTAIEITQRPDGGDEEVVGFDTDNAVVTIIGDGGGGDPSFDGFGLILESKTVASGSEFCLSVTTQDFTDIVGMQFSINYDPNVLEFVSVSNFNLPGLDVSSFGTPSAGRVTMSWLDNALAGQTLADGSKMFDICFRAKGANGTTTLVSFSNTPTPIEITQKSGNDEVIIDQTTVNGTVKIGEGGGEDPGFTGFGFLLSDASPQSGTEFCLQMAVQDFQDIVGVQYSINYDPAQLEFLRVQNFNLPGLDVSSFGNPKTGQVTMSWLDNALAGQTLPDGTVIFEVCFRATGTNGNITFVSITDTPTIIEVTQKVGNDEQEIPDVGVKIGTVSIGGQGIPAPFINEGSTVITKATCSNTSDGAINLEVGGGSGSYSYRWSYQNATTQDLNGIPPGQYSVTVTDTGNNKTVSGTFTVGQVNGAVLTLNPTFIDNGNDGAINLMTTNVTGTPTFQWTGPNGFSSQQQNLTGLSVLGQYCVTVNDGSGCPSQACANLYTVLKFSGINITNACGNQATGGISLQVTGGLPPYTYTWSNNTTGSTLTNVTPGTYSLTVTDAKNDVLSGNFEVNSVTNFQVSANVKKVTGVESNTNGSIALTVSGGSPGFTYAWSNNATTSSITGLAMGEYCVTVTDQSGCSFNQCYQVGFQALPLSFNVETTEVTCNGGSDGGFILNILGGSTPYQVKIGQNNPITSNDGQVKMQNMPAGNISFTITDGDNTSLQGTATIRQPQPIRVTEAIVVHDTDAPGCTGSIRISISGGTPEYTVLWNAPNAGPQIINLCEGNFVPQITDARGCIVSGQVIELTTFTVSGQVTNATCPADANGGVTLNVAGGSTPYTYRWENEANEVVSDTKNLTEANPGKYKVTISEKSGNSIIREFSVGASSNLGIEVEVLSNYNGFGVSCPDATDGLIRMQGVNGGGNYSYEWTLGEMMVGTTDQLSNAAPGVYEATVIDNNGCAMSKTINLTAPPKVELNASIKGATCFGDADGEIFITAAGGSGGSFYNYRWNNQVNGPRLSAVRAGTYQVTVTDGNNCATSSDFEVPQPDPIIVTVETEPATEGCNGSARAVVVGGTTPYSFKWNAPQNGQVIENLCPGEFMVEVVDSRGCRPEELRAEGLVADRRFPCLEVRPVISPNGDGLNEDFVINCVDEYPDNRLEIFNRWGEMVYFENNYSSGSFWTGTTVDGKKLPEGPYFYVLEYTDGNGNTQRLKGSLTIVLKE